VKKRKTQKRSKPEVPEIFANKPFRNLDKLYRNTPVLSRSAVPETRIPQRKSEDDVFRDAMKEVREIREFREMAVRRRPSTIPRKSQGLRDEGLAELEGIISGKLTMRLADTQEFVEWVNPKYSRELIKELHQGKFAVQDSIDLHGLVLDEAEDALRDFLAEAKLRGYRCIKIIHGRGLRSPKGPVLKNSVVSFLSSCYRKHVIGFSSARRNDGGLGAIYVLLV
jgi:DNA-nicking Smr family endonuclease